MRETVCECIVAFFLSFFFFLLESKIPPILNLKDSQSEIEPPPLTQPLVSLAGLMF